MSRFVWNGALYGNLDPDPEPEPARVPLIQARTYRYRCAHCALAWTYTPVESPAGSGEPPLEVQHSILLHFLEHHPYQVTNAPHVTPEGVYCACTCCTARRIADRVGRRLEDIRAEYLRRQETARAEKAIDAPAQITMLHKNKEGVYE